MTDQPTSRRVLVVSDDDDAGRFLSRTLEHAGLDTMSCPVDDIAIELAASFPPFDAVLGDSISDTVVQQVRNLADPDRAATPIVVLAPQDDHADHAADDAFHENADDADENDADENDTSGATYLTRPIAEHDLVEAIRATLPEDEPDEI